MGKYYRGGVCVTVAAGLLLVGAACGGGGDAISSPTNTTSTSGTSPAADAPDASPTPAFVAPQEKDASPAAGGVDSDGDGIADAVEERLAAEYMPFVSIHPNDKCPTHGLLYRLSPHPKEPGRVMLWVDVLYDEDCGASGHPGDDETFGVVIDPHVPAPAGILAVRGISHQGTPCEHDTTCGACKGMSACQTAMQGGAAYPVVFSSVDKHGNYADLNTCSGSVVCDFGGCAVATTSGSTPRVNAGEPGHPLVHDLTTDGFVTSANGWKQAALMHVDPWKPGKFGGAGDVSKDLVDPAFVIDTTACP